MNERRVIANITLTLDGHTTGPGGAYDMSCIAPHGVSEQARNALKEMTSAAVALLGSRNYEGGRDHQLNDDLTEVALAIRGLDLPEQA